MQALDGKIEKRSETLGRDAVYTSTSRLQRLPSYLTVHMVRFAWRQDIGKKAKIMVSLESICYSHPVLTQNQRKVKFPSEYDAVDIVTDSLKEKLLPVSRKLKEFEKDRAERRKVRKRTKVVQEKKPATGGDVEMTDPSVAPGADASAGPAATDVELKDESVYREGELKELEGLVHADLKADVGCSVSGLYELVGEFLGYIPLVLTLTRPNPAIVTHKGAAADAGHYMAFVKKSVFHPVSYSADGATGSLDEDDEDWYKFDDNKVSIFPKEKLTTLDGGGEDSSAYVLLYKTKPLA